MGIRPDVHQAWLTADSSDLIMHHADDTLSVEVMQRAGTTFIKQVEALEARLNQLLGAMSTHQPR